MFLWLVGPLFDVSALQLSIEREDTWFYVGCRLITSLSVQHRTTIEVITLELVHACLRWMCTFVAGHASQAAPAAVVGGH